MDVFEVLSSRGQRSYVRTLGKRRWVQLLPGQRVQIEGRNEEFVVLQVDEKGHLADLLKAGSMSKVEMGIPIALIRVVSDPAPEDDWPLSA